MKKYPLITAAVICAAALAAPVASAQTEPFSATYTEHFIPGHGNTPKCPDDAFGCGSGTAAGLGAFTIDTTFDDSCSCRVNTMTFSDGSTLVLDEDFVSSTGPGGSASSNMPPFSEGHPGTVVFSWTVAGGTGGLAEATGSGTEDFVSAGLVGTGTFNGTITTP